MSGPSALLEPEALREHVEGVLGPIALEQPALFPRLVAYILDGSKPESLLDLQAVTGQRVRSYFNVLGSDWTLRQTAQKKKKGAEHSPAYLAGDWRIRLYTAAPRVPHLVMVRLGRVLFTVSQTHEPTPATVPGWLAALVLDVFHSAQIWRPGKQQVAARERKIWGPEYLEALILAAGDAPEDAVGTVLAILFEKDTTRWELNSWNLPEQVVGALDYTVAHAASVPAALTERKAAGVLIFLEMLRQQPDAVRIFTTLIASLLGHPAKSVRTQAFTLLRGVDDDSVIDVLTPELTRLPASRVGDVAELLAWLPSGAGLLALQTALAGPLTGPKAATIQSVVDRATILQAPVDLAAPPAAVFLPEADLSPTFVADAQRVLDALVVKHTALLSDIPPGPDHDWRSKRHQAVLSCCKHLDLAMLAAHLAPTSAMPTPVTEGPAKGALDTYFDTKVTKKGRRVILREEVLTALLDALQLTELQKLRLLCTHPNAEWYVFHFLSMHGWMDLDLRILEDALRRSGRRDPASSIFSMAFTWDLTEDMAPEQVWPFLAEHVDVFETALLGSQETQYGSLSQSKAFDLLKFFPQLPAPLLAQVTNLAVRGSKTIARQAQDLLDRYPGAREIAEGCLVDPLAESRRSAAAWLGRLGDSTAIPALRAALAREKQPVARAATLAALDRLGEDTSADLSPSVLLAEATKGLRAKLPTTVDPSFLDRLPACTWADGTATPAEVIRWWVVFAVKLKDPAGADLLPRYVSLLSPQSQAELGTFLLTTWIEQDTRHPSDEDCRAFAATGGPVRYAMYQQYQKYYEAEAALSVEEVTEAVRREHATTYLDSATAQKGVLALTGGVPGAELANIISTYLRQHPGRRAQAEALTTVLSLSDHPAALQLLLSIARRFRQKSVQEHAAQCVDAIATKRGWTPDELTDRTVPTAGFEDNGTLELSYGDRTFIARLTPALTVELSTADGSVIKTLPPARVSEDAALVKEAKAQFSLMKKEVKQVRTVQTGRLYEAMCTRRVWSVPDWTEFVHAHPVMRRLATTLIWTCETELAAPVSFRPSEDGTLVDVEDNEVTLPSDGAVRLAHAVVLSPDEVNAWAEHLADYRVVKGFDQLSATAVVVDPTATANNDRQGWMSDTFTLRGAFTKRGYARGNSGDGGWFDEYVRDLPGTGQQIIIGFTGSMLPEENIAAAIGALSFRRTGRGRGDIRLSDLSPVLLAEAYQDYLAISAVGSFDVDWEKKSSW